MNQRLKELLSKPSGLILSSASNSPSCCWRPLMWIGGRNRTGRADRARPLRTASKTHPETAET